MAMHFTAMQLQCKPALNTYWMQGLDFDATKWAMEYFDFAGQKAAEKLQKYLHLQDVQDRILDSVSLAE